MSTATIAETIADHFGDSEEGQLSSRVLSTDEERKLLKRFWKAKKTLANKLSEQLNERVTADEKKNPLALAKFITNRLGRRRWREKKMRDLIREYTHLKHR